MPIPPPPPPPPRSLHQFPTAPLRQRPPPQSMTASRRYKAPGRVSCLQPENSVPVGVHGSPANGSLLKLIWAATRDEAADLDCPSRLETGPGRRGGRRHNGGGRPPRHGNYMSSQGGTSLAVWPRTAAGPSRLLAGVHLGGQPGPARRRSPPGR